MVNVAAIEQMLGFQHAAGASLLAMSARIEHGFPLESLARVSRMIAPDDNRFETRIVPAGTLKRRRRDRKPLTPVESERLQRVARVWAAAVDVFKTEDLARQFLTRPHPMLEHQAPLDVALRNTPGLEAVESLLGRAKYGSAA
jgi:putative toxin-antitoxin system antitoxin component (TIGR02293 family)